MVAGSMAAVTNDGSVRLKYTKKNKIPRIDLELVLGGNSSIDGELLGGDSITKYDLPDVLGDEPS